MFWEGRSTYAGKTKLIAIAIKKPINPIKANPIAATNETFLNSSKLGFLSKCQTLIH